VPIIQISLLKGYAPDIRHRLATKVTDLIVQMLGAVPEGTTVAIPELDRSSYMRGRELKTPIAPPPEATEVVKAYLAAMEARDLTTAKSYLAEDFWMEFPGGIRIHTLEELVTWAKPRYQSVTKTYDGFSEAYELEETVVFCHGRLQGTWPNGDAFSDIRFLDRFSLSKGKLKSQLVWNDLGEAQC